MEEIAGIIYKVGTEILLCKRSMGQSLGGYWSIPSGHVEDYESPPEGAFREFFEETGYDLQGDVIYLGRIFIRGEVEKVIHMFLHESDQMIDIDLDMAQDGFEHTECGFFDLDDLPRPMTQSFIDFLSRI
jgi:8-oxo-dGTP pyrophosphatase MutT (NUDIX family)